MPYDTYRNAYTATLFFDNKEIQSEKISINDEDLVDDIEFAYSMTYKALIDYYKISRNSGNLLITITKPFEEEK